MSLICYIFLKYDRMQLFSITSYTAWKRLLLSTMHAKDKLQVPLQLHLMGNCTGRIIIQYIIFMSEGDYLLNLIIILPLNRHPLPLLSSVVLMERVWKSFWFREHKYCTHTIQLDNRKITVKWPLNDSNFKRFCYNICCRTGNCNVL